MAEDATVPAPAITDEMIEAARLVLVERYLLGADRGWASATAVLRAALAGRTVVDLPGPDEIETAVREPYRYLCGLVHALVRDAAWKHTQDGALSTAIATDAAGMFRAGMSPKLTDAVITVAVDFLRAGLAAKSSGDSGLTCPGCGSGDSQVKRLVTCGLPCDHAWHEPVSETAESSGDGEPHGAT